MRLDQVQGLAKRKSLWFLRVVFRGDTSLIMTMIALLISGSCLQNTTPAQNNFS